MRVDGGSFRKGFLTASPGPLRKDAGDCRAHLWIQTPVADPNQGDQFPDTPLLIPCSISADADRFLQHIVVLTEKQVEI